MRELLRPVQTMIKEREPVAIEPVYNLVLEAIHRYGVRHHDLQVGGAEHLPEEGAFLIGSSHEKGADGFVAAVSVPKQNGVRKKVRTMAKAELWGPSYKYAGYALESLGAFPIDRTRPGHRMLRMSLSALSRGEAVVVFTEGTRTEGEERAESKKGIGYLSVKSGTPIAPMGIAYAEVDSPIKPGGKGPILVRVVYNPLVHPNSELSQSEAIDDVMARYEPAMQSAYDRANGWAQDDAELIKEGLENFEIMSYTYGYHASRWPVWPNTL